MVIQVHQQELDALFRKAEEGYLTCINDPENAYLQAEVPIPLADIVVRQGEVKVVLSPASLDTHQSEVYLWLYANGTYIGKYVSIMQSSGEVIEESLVFY